MIESITFKNFKALRDTTLPLGPFTLLVGPNGSGKSTALQALAVLAAYAPSNQVIDLAPYRTAGSTNGSPVTVELTVGWTPEFGRARMTARWTENAPRQPLRQWAEGRELSEADAPFRSRLARLRVFALDPRAIAQPVALNPSLELTEGGGNLAVVLDRLRDEVPERFEALNCEVGRLLPEFDRILFETPNTGVRGLLLRTRQGHHAIGASDLSHGTLLALAMLTLAYLPNPPSLVGIEEPDRGIHPRLLREVRDALYRLSYPEQFGESRPPVQVVATTQSPYFLDLFKDHPEEIVIAQKEGLEARFERLVDRPDINEILADAPLGEVWYSGVLGGVPG
jgi:predicted ATPase